ncbi:MAG TPA: fimbrillin family protein [Bacteroidales bacterium]|mgnify:FL=1|nr:fimbrillin family protein [Bacteroidales bacterium]
MKSFSKTATAVLMFLFMVACNVQDNPQDRQASPQSIQFTGRTENPATRTTLVNGIETAWESGSDRIGIFSLQARVSEETEPPAHNVAFSALESAKTSAFSGTMLWGTPAAEHVFHAYYPYQSLDEPAMDAVPVSLPAEQIQPGANDSGHLSALDFMVSTPVAVYAPESPGGASVNVDLTFNHVFTLMEYRITGSGQALTDIGLAGAGALSFSSGTMDLDQEPGADPYTITKSGTNTYVLAHLSASATLSPTPISVYMMVLPGEQTADMSIRVKTGWTWKTLTKTPPEGGFQRGSKYVTELDLDDAAFNDDEYVYIPDDNFRAYCLDNFDSDDDGKITFAEAESGALTVMNVSSRSIMSLEGLQYFTHVNTLQTVGNSLTYLDVGNNLEFQTINCNSNNLTTLKAGGFTNLKILYCSYNQLSTLDLSENPDLEILTCKDNLFTSLDVSNNPVLDYLDCRDNPDLQTIYVAAGQTISDLYKDDHTVIVTR